jgi:hypothetical protein
VLTNIHPPRPKTRPRSTHAELGSGFLTEVSLGHVEELSPGALFLRRFGSRSLVMLDVSSAGFAALTRDRDHRSVVLQNMAAVFQVRLSDKL